MAKIKGTLKELDGKVSFNGVKVSQPELSVLSRVFGTVIGEVKRPDGGGRSAKIWEFPEQITFEVKKIT